MEKVLLIEDEEVARKALAKVIEKEGWQVITAKDGEEGLELFKREQPEVVITDLRLPKIDGIEVMHTVKKILPSTEVILITAFGDYDTAITALREGAFDYLKKPIDVNELILSLGRAKEKIYARKNIPPFPTILLAEDEESTRERLSRVLSKEGWKVLPASDGEEAMSIFENNKIDIAVIDIKMPKKDGLTCLHEMRKITTDFEAIILTGYGDESAAIQAMRDGAVNFIRKPIDLDQLIVAIQRALDKLNTERVLKYRVRELELAREIIAKITRDKEIVVDVRDHTKRPAREFAQRLLDTIPIGLLVVDQDLNVIYSNEQMKKVLEFVPEKIDEKLMSSLSRIGIKELDFNAFKNTIQKIFSEKETTIETITIGKYAYITSTKIKILDEDKPMEVVLSIFRGERAT